MVIIIIIIIILVIIVIKNNNNNNIYKKKSVKQCQLNKQKLLLNTFNSCFIINVSCSYNNKLININI